MLRRYRVTERRAESRLCVPPAPPLWVPIEADSGGGGGSSEATKWKAGGRQHERGRDGEEGRAGPGSSRGEFLLSEGKERKILRRGVRRGKEAVQEEGKKQNK